MSPSQISTSALTWIDLDRFRRQIRQPAIQNLAVDVLRVVNLGSAGMPLSEAVQNTIAFLKMAAIELRRIAEQPSDVATDVLRVAEKLEDEAADMERRGFGAR